MNQKSTTKFFIFTLLLLLALHSNAQVGIGTPVPDGSSMLDIESSSRGVLIPRVTLTGTNDTTTITNGNVESLLVYNTVRFS